MLGAGARCREQQGGQRHELLAMADDDAHEQIDEFQKQTSRRCEGEGYGAHSESEGEENGSGTTATTGP